MLVRLTSLAIVLSLTGCASLESAADHTRDFTIRHPIVTAVGAAVVVGGAVAALDRHHHHGEAAVGPERPVCGRGPC